MKVLAAGSTESHQDSSQAGTPAHGTRFLGTWASLGYKHAAHSWHRGFACEKPQPPISMASEKMG